MSNNVFQNANYAWVFYVTDNRYLDFDANNDQARWDRLNSRWYESGRPYAEIDQIDGTPNPLLHRQLKHPAFDGYWQAVAPYKSDFARIHIPVLQITGYFDPAEISALYYYTEHERYFPAAEHYLVIGPYDHWGAQSAEKPWNVGGYGIDGAAQFDTPELTFAWFDHVMKGAPLPSLLADRVNCEVMDANAWRHAPSVPALHNEELTLYLSDSRIANRYALTSAKPARDGYVAQAVDFADRHTSNNFYPRAVLANSISEENCVSYVSEPFDAPVTIAGQITGVLRTVINKRDMDFSLAFYELLPDGTYFNLGYTLGRASFAADMEVRHLLSPGAVETIPFSRMPLVARQLAKGSRILVLLSANKNAYAQINYGTGKDVSEESIADAKSPLRVEWRNDSYIRIPIVREKRGRR
jgi:putative CocE/NonD family hydrolase